MWESTVRTRLKSPSAVPLSALEVPLLDTGELRLVSSLWYAEAEAVMRCEARGGGGEDGVGGRGEQEDGEGEDFEVKQVSRLVNHYVNSLLAHLIFVSTGCVQVPV